VLGDIGEGGHIRGDTAAALLAMALCAGELDEVMRPRGDLRIHLGCRGRRSGASERNGRRLGRAVTHRPGQDADNDERDENDAADEPDQDTIAIAHLRDLKLRATSSIGDNPDRSAGKAQTGLLVCG